ncbi:MAG: hypothetical protein DRJ37_04975 [Thermoprotei archaeon]|nr:MAG: hypothetical protein DRJ37_04975 [Thermoprotei archaeon]
MKIIYTIHALKRIKERNINRSDVEACVQRPDKLIYENKIRKAIRKIGNKALVVVYREEEKCIIIITAYATSKIEKYFSLT